MKLSPEANAASQRVSRIILEAHSLEPGLRTRADIAAEVQTAIAAALRTQRGEVLACLRHAIHWHDQITSADLARYRAATAGQRQQDDDAANNIDPIPADDYDQRIRRRAA